MSKLAINTAQNVNLDYKLIGLGERMVAFLIDGIILLTYMTIMENLINLSQIFDADGWTRRGFLGLFYLPAFFYSLICHIAFGGRTIGKIIMKIKVVELFAGVGGFRLGLEGWNGKSSSSQYNKPLNSNFECWELPDNFFK